MDVGGDAKEKFKAESEHREVVPRAVTAPAPRPARRAPRALSLAPDGRLRPGSGVEPALDLSPRPTAEPCELSIVMPCLNEAETLAACIRKARAFLAEHGVDGEVVVADNGSTDGSQDIARTCGARVVGVAARGYGAALRGGIAAARGRYVIMGDADDSYDFARLEAFVAKLREGCDLVMGNRFAGGIAPGAMPPLHRYLGNPVLSWLGRLFFGSPVGDFHCGLRGFRREAIARLNLQTTGMEFASEMAVKATLHGLRIAEVPTALAVDGRSRPPHLRSWPDGWRHLRFLLMCCPRWLFLYPGLALIALGAALGAAVASGPQPLSPASLGTATALAGAALLIVGVQAVSFFWLAWQVGVSRGLLPGGPLFRRARERLTLERTLVAGLALVALGTAGVVGAAPMGEAGGLGDAGDRLALRLAFPATLALAAGVQVILTGFLSSILAGGER